MGWLPDFRDPKDRLVFEMGVAFGQVKTLSALHHWVEHYLVPQCGADHVALCLARPERPLEYEWKTQTLGGLLRDYAEWAEGDFVRRAVTASHHHNQALSDVQMLRGGRLEETETWRRSRAHGMKLRHVMSAAIVPGRGGGHGGVTLYSERRKPFSDPQRHLLQYFMPGLQQVFLELTRPLGAGLLREDWGRLLTRKEREVANLLLSQGGRNRDLAEDLGLAEQTVKEHLKRIYRKTGAEGRGDLMIRGRRSS